MTRQLRFDLGSCLFFGDNLDVLANYVADESVDLVYLDPPFNSQRSYNAIFKHHDGTPAAAQIKAFDDTWRWNLESEITFRRIVEMGGPVSRVLRAFRDTLDTSDMLAYLTMMAPRLLELHRVLKDTGSLYLHCDPTASHYLKVLLDAIFLPTNFRSEVIWKRTHAHSGGNRFGPVHDVVLLYAKSPGSVCTPARVPYSQEYVDSKFKNADPDGRRYRSTILTGSGTRNGDSGKPWRGIDPNKTHRHWAVPGYLRPLLGSPTTIQDALDRLDDMGRILWPKKPGGSPSLKQYIDDMGGVETQDVWDDIPPINSQAKERLGYPTQKPIALLERIIESSSNPGDVVLDPFCGCGTAIDAAQRLGRRWVGIDVTTVAIEVIQKRLARDYPALDYSVRGVPLTMEDVDFLADRDKYAFQQWVCDRLGIDADIRKGADKGIDGEIVRYAGDHPWRAVVSVKGGGVNVTMVRDLRGTMEREKADSGIFVTRKKPTGPMKTEALAAGVTAEGIPKIQILTAEDLVNGKRPQIPHQTGLVPLAPPLEPERQDRVPVHPRQAASA
jgi:DNA modification methylase